MAENSDKAILFLSAPKRENLCYITSYINVSETHDPSAKSNYHWQILKCRQLIFSQKEIIASPVRGTEHQIFIVMNPQFYKSGVLQPLLHNLNMHACDPLPVSNGIYETCLRYTITAHIAPQWNQVDNYLIRGRNFLTETTPLDAIRLEVGVNENEMYVVVWPVRVRLGKLKLEDLNVPEALSQQFATQSTASISDLTLGAQWIHVLPSLKKGRITSVSRQIPKTCPYQTYKDIKRHWKNMARHSQPNSEPPETTPSKYRSLIGRTCDERMCKYGYRIPESDEHIIYYTLSFHRLNPTPYTYPSVCVRPDPMTVVPHMAPMSVIKAFFADLTKKMPTICKDKFAVNSKIGYAVAELHHWREQLGKSNISARPSVRLPACITSIESPMFSVTSARGKTSPTDMFSTQNSANISLATQTQRSTTCSTQRFQSSSTSSRPTPTEHSADFTRPTQGRALNGQSSRLIPNQGDPLNAQTLGFTPTQYRHLGGQNMSGKSPRFIPTQGHPSSDQTPRFTPIQDHHLSGQNMSGKSLVITPTQNRPLNGQSMAGQSPRFTPTQDGSINGQIKSGQSVNYTPIQGRPLSGQSLTGQPSSINQNQGRLLSDQIKPSQPASLTQTQSQIKSTQPTSLAPMQGRPLSKQTKSGQSASFTQNQTNSSNGESSSCQYTGLHFTKTRPLKYVNIISRQSPTLTPSQAHSSKSQSSSGQRTSLHFTQIRPSNKQRKFGQSATFPSSQGSQSANETHVNARVITPLQSSRFENQANIKLATSVASQRSSGGCVSKAGHEPISGDSPPNYVPFALSDRSPRVEEGCIPITPPSAAKHRPIFLPNTSKYSSQSNKLKATNQVHFGNTADKIRPDVTQAGQQVERLPPFTVSFASRLPNSSNTTGTNKMKRSANSQENTPSGAPTAKKPRPKPQVQAGVNVEDLAANGGLDKLNTATLTAWLREKGVACKAKDKKADLIGKVLNYLVNGKQ